MSFLGTPFAAASQTYDTLDDGAKADSMGPPEAPSLNPTPTPPDVTKTGLVAKSSSNTKYWIAGGVAAVAAVALIALRKKQQPTSGCGCGK